MEKLNRRMNHLQAQKRFKILQLPAKQQEAIIALSSQTICKSSKNTRPLHNERTNRQHG